MWYTAFDITKRSGEKRSGLHKIYYGDEYLRKACRIICGIFKLSPVFRIGGDEFAVILEGEDYENRDELISRLTELSMKNAGTEDGVVIAAGMAVREENETFNDVFHRADEQMYINKSKLKAKRPSHNLR